MSLRVRLMIIMWIPASAGMTGVGRVVGFRGRAQGPAPTITVGDRACPRLDRGVLCLSGGTRGDVVTSAVDD